MHPRTACSFFNNDIHPYFMQPKPSINLKPLFALIAICVPVIPLLQAQEASPPAADGQIESAPEAKQQASKAGYPAFSWDRVPLAFHFGRMHAIMTDEEINYVADRGSLITFTKAHACRPMGSTEKGVAHEVKRLKALNPDLKVLIYWNIFIKYDFFDAVKDVQPEWLLRNRAGQALKKFERRELFDILNPDFLEWWPAKAKQIIDQNDCDGIFVDAVQQPKAWYVRSKYGHPVDNRGLISRIEKTVKKLMTDAQKNMGPESLLIYNGINSTATSPARGKEYLPHSDGAIFDFFTVLVSEAPDAIAHDIAAIQDAGEQGKICVVKAWPSSELYFRNKEAMQRPIAELIQEARDHITFPLACYLVAAGPYSYFCYSWGFTEREELPNLGSFVRYPELDKPLGKPKGPANKVGYVYTRDFEHASVRVDVQARKATIEWKGQNK